MTLTDREIDERVAKAMGRAYSIHIHFAPSSNHIDMMRVIEYARGKGLEWTLQSTPSGGWYVVIETDDDTISINLGPTLPRAVCEAFLAAVEGGAK